MAFNFSKTIAVAASTGMMLGAITACGGSGTPADAPGASDPAAAAAGAKECCKGNNECKGKGGCAVEGKNDCAGKNECKSAGGCNAHCPK
jgi:hypothetical protein